MWNKDRIELKYYFIDTLIQAGLWDQFLLDYGPTWEAEKWYHDGWYFQEDKIQLRFCDIWDKHEDGYNWNFIDEDTVELVQLFLDDGWQITYNSGDEEDCLFIMEFKEGKI